MTLPKIPLTPLFGEIGFSADWKYHSLVDKIGMSNDGETELVQSTHRGRFELWHKSGLKMRIDLEPFLDNAAEALRLEAESRKEPADAQS